MNVVKGGVHGWEYSLVEERSLSMYEVLSLVSRASKKGRHIGLFALWFPPGIFNTGSLLATRETQALPLFPAVYFLFVRKLNYVSIYHFVCLFVCGRQG